MLAQARVLASVVAAALVLAASGCSGSSSGQSGPSAAADASPTGSPLEAASSPTPTLTGEEILRRSDAAMQGRPVITEALGWRRGDVRPAADIPLVAFQDDTRYMSLSGGIAGDCQESTRTANPLATRGEGGSNSPIARLGGTRPEEVEVLDETALDGHPAWVIRFRYKSPGYEGPVPREHTEWIAKDDFRLLRAEIEQLDPFGFTGQTVVLFDYQDLTPDCGRKARASFADLRPTTRPRLTPADR